MGISSAKNLTSDNCLAVYIYVLFDNESEDFISTFELEIPEEGVDIAQYYSILDGINYAKFKMDKLVESLDEIIMDEDDEE